MHTCDATYRTFSIKISSKCARPPFGGWEQDYLSCISYVAEFICLHTCSADLTSFWCVRCLMTTVSSSSLRHRPWSRPIPTLWSLGLRTHPDPMEGGRWVQCLSICQGRLTQSLYVFSRYPCYSCLQGSLSLSASTSTLLVFSSCPEHSGTASLSCTLRRSHQLSLSPSFTVRAECQSPMPRRWWL